MFERIGMMFSKASLNIPLGHIYLEQHSTCSMIKTISPLVLRHSRCQQIIRYVLTAMDLPEGGYVRAFLL